MSDGARIPRDEATAKIAPLLDLLRPAVISGAIAGSYRREKPTIGDLEAVFIPSPNFHAHLDKLDAQGVITRGRAWGQKQRQFIYDGLKIDLYTAAEDNYGYILWLRTGAADANKRVVTFLKNKANPAPFRLEEGFVWTETHKLHVPDEQTFFRLLGIPLIEPRDREVPTYARLFQSALSHRWGDPTPFIKIENTTQDSMFDTETVSELVIERRGRYTPTPEAHQQGMRLLRGQALPQDAPRLRELITMYERAMKEAVSAHMREYNARKIAEYQKQLEEIENAQPHPASRTSAGTRHG